MPLTPLQQEVVDRIKAKGRSRDGCSYDRIAIREQKQKNAGLTSRQRDAMLAFIAHGTVKAAAFAMGVTYHQYYSHLQTVEGRLGITRNQFAQWAREKGWIA